jgi:hypothetical protein
MVEVKVEEAALDFVVKVEEDDYHTSTTSINMTTLV